MIIAARDMSVVKLLREGETNQGLKHELFDRQVEFHRLKSVVEN